MPRCNSGFPLKIKRFSATRSGNVLNIRIQTGLVLQPAGFSARNWYATKGAHEEEI
jgi:hypothetical protein